MLNICSIQELQADMARRQRVLMNAAMIEARDREERLRLDSPLPPSPETSHQASSASRLPVSATTHLESTLPPLAPNIKQDPPPSTHTESPPPPHTPPARQGLPEMPSESFEPQSWSPRARVRGQ